MLVHETNQPPTSFNDPGDATVFLRPSGLENVGGFKFQAERDWCDGVRRVMKGGDETNP